MKLDKIVNECLKRYLNENVLKEYLSKQGVKIWQRFRPNGIGNANGDREEYRKYVRKERRKSKAKGKKADASIYFQPIRVVHNEWLIHFSDDTSSESIVRNGFKGSPLSKVPYSWGTRSTRKGYNYAFLLSDIASKDKDEEGGNVYGFEGPHGVIFKANGVIGYHYGDKNRQVVFYGNDVKEILYFHDNILYNKSGKPIFKGNKVHGLNGKDYGNLWDSIRDFYKWLINNEHQYRRQIN